jgi:arginine repressor
LSRDIRDLGLAKTPDEEWPEVVGTLAGDDTIVVIAPDNATAETVRTKFLAMIEPG